MRLSPENATALIIDLQERIVPAMNERERLIRRSKFLLSGLSVFSLPIVLTRQYPKGLGDVLPEISELAPEAKIFDKTTFSCLDDKATRDYFSLDARPNVLLAGIETHICVLQTALDLQALGKNVYLVADCLSSRDAFDAQIALERMARAGVVLATSESALFEMTRDSKSAYFKSISKLATSCK